jgi:hypothetical protein
MLDDDRGEAPPEEDDHIHAKLESLERGMSSLHDELDALRRRVTELEDQQNQGDAGWVRTVLWVLFLLVPFAGVAFLIYYMAVGL